MIVVVSRSIARQLKSDSYALVTPWSLLAFHTSVLNTLTVVTNIVWTLEFQPCHELLIMLFISSSI